MYLCVRGIDFASFHDLFIRLLNCFDSVQMFVFHLITKPAIGIYILQLIWYSTYRAQK
jgi:hypothetical protein